MHSNCVISNSKLTSTTEWNEMIDGFSEYGKIFCPLLIGCVYASWKVVSQSRYTAHFSGKHIWRYAVENRSFILLSTVLKACVHTNNSGNIVENYVKWIFCARTTILLHTRFVKRCDAILTSQNLTIAQNWSVLALLDNVQKCEAENKIWGPEKILQKNSLGPSRTPDDVGFGLKIPWTWF